MHCRKRHSELGKLKDPSTSANVYWQFEKESDGRSGEPLFWGERCRIKHLPTRRFLAVVYDQLEGKYNVSDSSIDNDYVTSDVLFPFIQVTLKERSTAGSVNSSQSDLETVFSLFPVIQV